jgi:hypothetical protein
MKAKIALLFAVLGGSVIACIAFSLFLSGGTEILVGTSDKGAIDRANAEVIEAGAPAAGEIADADAELAGAIVDDQIEILEETHQEASDLQSEKLLAEREEVVLEIAQKTALAETKTSALKYFVWLALGTVTVVAFTYMYHVISITSLNRVRAALDVRVQLLDNGDVVFHPSPHAVLTESAKTTIKPWALPHVIRIAGGELNLPENLVALLMKLTLVHDIAPQMPAGTDFGAVVNTGVGIRDLNTNLEDPNLLEN